MKFHATYEAGFLPCEVAAYMLHPTDEELRNTYLSRKMAEYTLFCATEDGLESVPTEVLKDLLESPGSAQANAVEYLSIMGSVAGELLLNLIKLSASDEEASVGKAIHLGAPYFKEAKNSLGARISPSKSSIQRAWSAYKPVAHFWAALRIHIQATANPSTTISPDSYLQLLSLAHELGKLAPTLTSTHAGAPIYSPDVLWTIPNFVELPGCTFNCLGLDDQEREHLRGYKAPSVRKYDS